MPTEELIRQIVNGLKSTYALQSVSIFGSYAEGRATDKSDLDLLVEFEQPTVSLLKLNGLKYDLERRAGNACRRDSRSAAVRQHDSSWKGRARAMNNRDRQICGKCFQKSPY